MCFSVVFDMAMKTRVSSLYSALQDYIQNADGTPTTWFITWESVYDFIFAFIIIDGLWVWTFNCIFSLYYLIALIIESYGALRRASVAKFNDINNICIACTLNREEITKKCPHGFDSHVKNEHN